MSTPNVVSMTPINLVQLKAKLAEVKERDGELNFRSSKTDEYLNQFSLISEKKADELYNKLVELNIPRLKDEHYHKIIDIMPTKLEDVKAVLSGYSLTVTNENLKKIATLVEEYQK